MARERFRLTAEPVGDCRWCPSVAARPAHAWAVIRPSGRKGGYPRAAQKEPVCELHAERLSFQGAEIVAEGP